MKKLYMGLIVVLFVGLIFVSGCTNLPFLSEREMKHQLPEDYVSPDKIYETTQSTKVIDLDTENEKLICKILKRDNLEVYSGDGYYCKMYDTECRCL